MLTSSESFCWEGDMLINDFRLTDFMKWLMILVNVLDLLLKKEET